MKTIKLIFAFILIINCSGFSQDDKFVCKYDDWADRHNENEKWNSLLDQACKEINSGNYKQAINTLDQAMAIDSASNGGDVNVFIETQYRRLRDFVENSPALTASAGTEKPVATQETPSDNSAKEKEVIKQEDPAPVVVETKEVVESTSGNDNSASTNSKQSEPEIQQEPASNEVKLDNGTTSSQDVPTSDPIDQKTADNTGDGVATTIETTEKATDNDSPAKEAPEKAMEPIYTESEAKSEKEPEKVASEPVVNEDAEEINFSEAEKSAFQEKGMQKVKQLENFIFQVGSKTSPMSLSSQAIENAIKLFDKEDRTVQVSSVNVAAKPKFKIRQYLQRVRNLNYDDITIEWADLQYASDFTKGPDGNYYAYVVFSQRFTGSKDNQIVYQDVTTKRTQIILKIYEKAVQGEITENWDVFLGDISVVQTDTN